MRITVWIPLGAVVLWAHGASAAETPPPEPAPAPVTAPPGELAPSAPLRSLPQVELHGAAYFLFYQPLSTLDALTPFAKPITPKDTSFGLSFASLELKGKLEDFGVFVNPRFSDTKVRAFYTSNLWVQQAYAFYELPELTAKVGKIENRFSRLGDDTFYGNIPYFDGMKLDMDYGVSVEGSAAASSELSLAYAAQYFVVDGHTNGSLRNRDTIWIKGAHRRHIAVARVEPSYRFSSTSSLRLGLAGQFCRVDLGKGPEQNVFRLDTDLSLAAGPVKVFGEFIAQFGRTVKDYPIASVPATATMPARAGQSSAYNLYGLAGAEAQVGLFLPRYSFSVVRYKDVGVTEMLHVPGVTITLHDNVALMLEYAYWHRLDPRRSWLLDNSFNAVIQARF